MNISLNKRLLIGFGLSILILFISSIASYVSIKNLLDSATMVRHTNEVIANLENALSSMKDAETGQRGYLLTGDDRFLEPYTGAYGKAAAQLDRVIALVNDNDVQLAKVKKLRFSMDQRLNHLETIIQKRKTGQPISVTDLMKGKEYMDDARRIVADMEITEKTLLEQRTESLNRFSTYTPMLIVIAAILALAITIFFYIRVRNDFAQKLKLQRELEAKDADITRRIGIIRNVANNIADGDYSIRTIDEGDDGLGNLSVSLNKMAESLETSFNALSDKEWLQSGIARVNEQTMGEQDIEVLTKQVLEQVSTYTGSLSGAVYLFEYDYLDLNSTYALAPDLVRKRLALGEGLAGQAAASGKELLTEAIAAERMNVPVAGGEITPRYIYALPIFHDRTLKAVIELASIEGYTRRDLDFLRQAAHIIGIAINTAQNRKQLQVLFEETQAQAEELQAQHSELEQLNHELESQTLKLQTSEEELKVQQEELQQVNQELEERASQLEEKNELITERNLDIQRKAEELAQITRYKSEFLANMSHELRTPLNSILLLSRLLAENAEATLTDDQIEYAQVIQNSGSSLLLLIDEILDLSKIEAGKLELDYSHLRIEDITSELSSLFKPIAREKNLDLKVTIDEDAPGMIETDKQRLDQVLKNLLSNALKFTKHGFVELEIGTAGKDRSMVSFTVRDTGIGIPKEKQALVFEAFRQADGSTRRKYGGTGLGLSISRELTKLLGGEIRVHSEEGKGSEFIIYIPAQRPLPGSNTAEELAPQSNEAAETMQQPAKFVTDVIPEAIADDRDQVYPEDKVVLIVEDDTAFARALLDFTHSKGYKGIVSVRGDEGITLAGKYLPMAILLDIQLPVKDGWEVMEALKSNRQTRHIPVHIMSSYAVKKESLMKGAIDFINKPVAYDKMEEIFKRIDYVLNKQNKKVMIIEENPKHAKALAYFLEKYNVTGQISSSVGEGVNALADDEVQCVILDMGIPDENSYETLEAIKKNPGLEDLPIIIFTGKNLSASESIKIKQYADSIVVKTAHSYQRILDEVSLFLHLLEEDKKANQRDFKKLGSLDDVLAGRKVLIADDDVRNIYSLTKTLEQHRMQVLSAIDGRDALAVLDANQDVDVVLMDIMMPEMDGFEAMKKIRQQPQFRNLPIIAVTAKAMTGDRQRCTDAGASDYISKPVDIDQLLSLLRVWLYEKMS